MLSKFFDGVTVTYIDPTQALPVLRSLGAKAVRLWSEVPFTRPYSISPVTLHEAQVYKHAHLLVDLLVTLPTTPRAPTHVPSYSAVYGYFHWLATKHPEVLRVIDRWEIVNEPDFPRYFPRNRLHHYVRNVLRGAWNALHPFGETIVGAGAVAESSWRTLRSAGYLKYCDIANVHPYRTSATQEARAIDDAVHIFSGKPVTATEFNMHPVDRNVTSWAQQLRLVHRTAARRLESAFYFRFGYTTQTMAGPAGLVFTNRSTYTPHQPFYDLYQDWTEHADTDPVQAVLA
jgi:hypothetical protein